MRMEAMYTLTVASVVASVLLISQGARADSCPQHVKDIEGGHTAVHKNVCYLFIDNELFWNRARDSCWSLGGEMLSVENEETMEFIKGKLNSRELGWSRDGVWLGARFKSGRWRWTNGREVTYSHWSEGEPSKFLGILSVEDCAQMRKEDGWKWHDYPCGAMKFHYNYICEFPLSKPGDTAGRVSSSASNQEKDNGNTNLLTIIIGLSAGFLIILVIMFLLLHFYHRRNKNKNNNSQPVVHYTNNSYENRRGSTPPHQELPPLPAPRPPLPTPGDSGDGLYLTPSEVTYPMYTEVNKPTHLHNMRFPEKRHECSHVTSGASNSACSSPWSSSELGACGGSDPEQDLKTPLMSITAVNHNNTTTTTNHAKTNGIMADTNGVAGGPVPCGCGHSQSSLGSQGEYIAMSSLVDKENGSCGGKANGTCVKDVDEMKHTYSNVDHKESAVENLYEVLP